MSGFARWRWWGLAFGLVAAATLFVVLLRPEARPGAAAAAAPAAEVSTAKVVQETAQPVPAASVAAVGHGPDEIEVCGGAWLHPQADGSIAPADADRATWAPKERAAILAKLAADPGELPRLAAVLMAAVDRRDRNELALIGAGAVCEGSDCAAAQAAQTEFAQARDAIARAALATDDPKVYAFALNVCGPRGEGGCQLLSARQWARLDPGNASPWLTLLGEAVVRKDVAAQTEALFHIASAERNDFGASALTRAVLKAVPDEGDKPMLAGMRMALGAFGVEAAWTIPGYQGLSDLCRADAVRDANRSQVCGQVAEVLAERSDTMIGRLIGGSIGTRVGWPARRADQMRGEYNAYLQSMVDGGSENSIDLGCGRLQRELRGLRSRALVGEVGAVRAWVANSGKQADDFVREEQARQRPSDRARAETAASAASAAR